MTVQLAYREVAHAKLEARRFLRPTRTLFTTRDDNTLWARWKNTWSTANAYFTGLLVPGGKNMDRIAKAADVPVDAVERFIRDSPWDHADVQAHLVTHVPPEIQDARAALVWDDFGIAKQGQHSVGAYRQYSGVLGKTGNCQVAVNLTYAAPGRERNADQRTWPLGTELYLPQAWVEDDEFEDLRDEVHLPARTRFRTKHEIAWTLLERALDAQVPHAVTIGDAEYGTDAELRRRLRERGEAYVLGVQPTNLRCIDADTPIEPAGQPRPHGGEPTRHARYPEATPVHNAKELAAATRAWTRVEWARGTKGPLIARFARVRIRVCEGSLRNRWATDEVGWLLLEQRSNELKAHLCWGLDDAALEELVAHAHLRWTIEQFHKEAKQYLGLDRFEGRTWKGWHHHVTLVLLAYAFLAWTRARQPGEALPSLPETARAVGVARVALDFMDQGLRKEKARTMAEGFVRRYTEW